MLRSLKLTCKSFVNHIFYKLWSKKQHFKNPAKPTYVDLIITNKGRMFQNAKTYETVLSDFLRLVVR